MRQGPDLAITGQMLAEDIVKHLFSVKRGAAITDADKSLLRFWLEHAIECYEEKRQQRA